MLSNTTIRATASVCAALVIALVGTGFVSSAYKRERSKLGDRHFKAGLKLTAVDDLTGASEEFRKALLFAPDKREYRLSLATALLSGGKLEEAQSHLEQLSEEDPTNGRINLLLARVAMRDHHLNEAMESYQRAVYEYWPPDDFSKRREARWEYIDVLEQTGQNRNQLVGELLQLYGNLPEHSDQRLRVGTQLLRNGADAEAAHVFRDVLKDKADDSVQSRVGAHMGLARISFRTGDFIETRHEYQRALREDPNDGEAAAALQQINEIVDIAPELPNLSASERLRRSGNLLRRVEADLTQCSDQGIPPESLQTRLDETKRLTEQRVPDKEDAASRLQEAAQGLWRDRAQYCSAGRGKDLALEAVLPRLGHE